MTSCKKNQHQDSAKQELFIDLTKNCEQSADDDSDDCDVLISDEMVENIELSEESPDTEEMTSKMYWENVLGTLEKARTTVELLEIATQIKATIKPLWKRVLDLKFNVDLDFIDTNALSLLPEDGPKDLIPVWTLGHGNCLGCSVSTGYIGNDSMHLELLARMVIEGVIKKKHYMSAECLNRGASLVREDETLPEVFAKYSDNYVSGQRIMDTTIDNLYSKELLDCTKINSYMGLWQLAQAASVINVPIQSIYPEGCSDPVMRLDFHWTFFPVQYNEETSDDRIFVMWTNMHKGCAPVHFVPLLPRISKYAIF